MAITPAQFLQYLFYKTLKLKLTVFTLSTSQLFNFRFTVVGFKTLKTHSVSLSKYIRT